MDPQAAWDQLLEAYAEHDWAAIEELADGLLAWLDGQGFPPQTTAGRNLGADWNRAVARSACQFVLQRAKEGAINEPIEG